MDEKKIIELFKERKRKIPLITILSFATTFVFYGLFHLAAFNLIIQIEKEVLRYTVLVIAFIIMFGIILAITIPLNNSIYKCPNCGGSVKDGRSIHMHTFCPKCGIRIQEDK